MKIVKKSMYGYGHWHQLRLMVNGILFGPMMHFLFMLSLRISKLPSTILMVFIVLAVIPFSLAIATFFIAPRIRTPSEERYAYVWRTKDRGILLYNCISMTKKIGFLTDLLLITGSKCYVQSCGNVVQQAELKQRLEHYMTVGRIGFKIVLGHGDERLFEAVNNLLCFPLNVLPKERREKVLKCRHTLPGPSF